jgi:cell division septation protein DedD
MLIQRPISYRARVLFTAIAWAGIAASSASAAVTSLAVQDTANAPDWSVQQNLQVGSVEYGDRAFTFSAVPSVVAGSEWIRTANDSKAFAGTTLVTFSVSAASDVYVAHNDSISPKPSWLTGWTDSGANLVNNEGTPRTFSLFRKSFAAGAVVSLGDNGNTSSGMYTIVVKATAPTPTPTPVTPTPTPVPPTPTPVTPTPTPIGCAKWSPVSANVTASTNDGNVPANTVDGSLTTRWSGSGDGAWLQVDLGGVMTVCSVKIAVYNGNSRQNRFDLLLGQNTSTWSTTLTGALTGGTTTNLETFDFADADARFVRYVGHNSTVGTFNSVTEFEVWVKPSCSACPTPTPTPATPTPTPITPTPTPNGTPNGNPIIPPKWAFGVLYGSYYNQTQELDAMNRLRAGGYPVDAMWVDSSWLSSNYNDDAPAYIRFKFDSTQFPDAAGMISSLHSNHIKFGVWEWPYIDKTNSLYSTGANNHYFIEDGSGNVVNGGGWHGVTFTGQFDYTNPASVTWWKSLNKPLMDMGMDFFKIDTYSTVPSGGVLKDGTTSADHLRQAYHKAEFETTQTAKSSQGRGFILAHRQSATNNIRFPGLWTGDVASTWAGLQGSINTSKGFNSTGTAAYWTGDTGGYNSGEPSDELYIRWTQFGTFSPINEFFSQKTSKTRFPWAFGTQAQSNVRTYTKLRMRLLPFRYSNAQVAYHETPIQWPVTFGATDIMLLGSGSSQMLVAPVVVAGATTRSVAFPAGTWISYWTGATQAGGVTATVPAPLDRVPIYIKAGSIIPFGPDINWVDEKAADPLTLDIYPSGSTSYTLYEDDGVSNGYIGGAFTKTVFTCNTSGGITVGLGAATGGYNGQLANRTYILKINKQATDPGTVNWTGGGLTHHSTQSAFDTASEGWFYDATADIVWVKVPTSTSTATQVTF